MKRSLLFVAALTMIFSSFVFAAEPLTDKDQEEALLTFLTGSYEVIGKYPDGKGAYWGTMALTRQGNELQITRNIKGKKTTGRAKIVTVTADGIPVLQADFTEIKQKLQLTYCIGSDPDNYARLTGKVYFADRETKMPGLEALFIRHISDK